MRHSARLLAASTVLPLLAASCGGGGGDDANDPLTATVQGTVVNAPNPVSGVRIVLTGSGGTFTVTTTGNGTYDLSGVPTGTYTVDVYGDGVFDAAGNPLPDKIDLHLAGVEVAAGVASIGGSPIFLPERGIGSTVDTSGDTTGTIPAGTVIEDPGTGIALVFDVATQVTFQNASDTTLTLTPIPTDQTPVALPNGLTAASIVSIDPAGATFDVRPTISLPNDAGLPGGLDGVSLQRLAFGTGAWTPFGTGTVSSDGTRIVSDAGAGLPVTGIVAVAVTPFCSTTVAGRVEDGIGNGIAGVQVTTVGGRTSTTDANGDYSISSVLLPSSNFPVVVTAVPAVNSGFSPNDSPMEMAQCGGTTSVTDIVLATLAVDTTAPTIVSTSPADQDADVADNVSLSATFNETISPGSADADTVRVRADGVDVPGAISVSTSMGASTISFVPTDLLPLGASCTFELGADLMDAAGNRLGSTNTISFTTAAATGGGATTIDVTPDAPAALDTGDTLALTAAVSDASGAPITGATVDWSSDDTTVATVDATGVVTARSAGTANITGAFGRVSDAVPVTVNVPAVDSVQLTGGQSSIAVGAAFVLEATALDSGMNRLEGVQFAWTSDAPNVATVDAFGTVRAVGAGGPATITATDPVSTESAAFAVTVVDPAGVSDVVVTAPETMIGSGTSVQFTATAYDGQQNVVPGVTYTWSTTNAGVATVSPSGVVTGAGAGTATITASADGSTNASGDAVVTGFVDSPLVVTVLGGNDGTTGVSGLRVLRHDASTGAFLEELETDGSGVANFGLTNMERASITVLRDPAQVQTGNVLRSVLDVPVGPISMTWDDAAPLATLSVSASGFKGTDEATILVGALERGESRTASSKSPTITVGSIAPRIEQPNDRVSLIAIGTDSSSNDRVPTSAAFLLDQDPAQIDQSTALVTLDTALLTAVPFTSDRAAVPGDVAILRDGLVFHMSNGSPQASTTGRAVAAIPSGTDGVSIAIEAPAQQTDATVNRRLSYASVPATIELTMPEIELLPIAFDGGTRTVSWSASGVDTAGLDVGHLDLDYVFLALQGNQTQRWELTFAGSRSSVVLPALPSSLLFLQPGESTTNIGLRLGDYSGVTGYEALLGAARTYAGNLERFRLTTQSDVAGVALDQVPVSSTITGTGAGTVTVDWGTGAVQISSTDVVQVPLGANVTITASTTGNVLVTQFTSSAGVASGVGTQTATLNFTASQGVFNSIQFD